MNYCKTVVATFGKVESILCSKLLYLVESTLKKHVAFALCDFHDLPAQTKTPAFFLIEILKTQIKYTTYAVYLLS